jgi:hypothetical protein
MPRPIQSGRPTLAAGILSALLAAIPTTAACGGNADPGPLGSRDVLTVVPESIRLTDPRDARQLVVTGRFADGATRDLTHLAAIEADAPGIVSIEAGYVTPKKNGRASLLIRFQGREVRVPVEVAGLDVPNRVSFRREVVAAFNVSGCNAGACHGTPSGKNGFKLSLRGFDPAADFLQLTRDLSSRRVSAFDPSASLILEKGEGRVPHEGGQKLVPDGFHDRLVREWIASGAPDDPANLPAHVGTEVAPGPRTIQAPVNRQQLSVTARFADGSTRDVTRLTVFSSSDESVARVDANGLVEFSGPGEVAILARYLEQLVPTRLSYVDPASAQPWPDPPANNYVDEHLFRKMKKLGLAPAPLAPDHEFLRRAYLDLAGILPTPEEVRAFLVDNRPDKRAKVVDALLERPEYADFWALKWADVLGNNRRAIQAKGTYSFHLWLRDRIARNVPFDAVARDIVSAKGSTFVNPPVNFFRNDRVAKEAEIVAQNTAQVFLGVRIACARCHNHPFEKWTQDDYYGLTAFFSRLTSKTDPLNPRIARFNTGALVIEDDRSGETIHPRTNKVARPKFPGGPVAEIPAGGERRAVFAEWLTRSDNPFFARELANRTWYHLLGRGIIDPVDDVRDSNPPASDELLDALAKDLVDHQFDVKHLIRTIMGSRVYQLVALSDSEVGGGKRYFAAAVIRLLPAEAMLDALSAATGVPEVFGDPDRRNADVGQRVLDADSQRKTFGDIPIGTRSAQLPDGDVLQHPFLSAFGQPARETACACERSDDTGLSHALQLINGPSVKEKLTTPNNRIGLLLSSRRPSAEILEEIYLATLSRLPDDHERQVGLAYVERASDRRKAWEDIQWSLVNAREFLFRH